MLHLASLHSADPLFQRAVGELIEAHITCLKQHKGRTQAETEPPADVQLHIASTPRQACKPRDHEPPAPMIFTPPPETHRPEKQPVANSLQRKGHPLANGAEVSGASGISTNSPQRKGHPPANAAEFSGASGISDSFGSKYTGLTGLKSDLQNSEHTKQSRDGSSKGTNRSIKLACVSEVKLMEEEHQQKRRISVNAVDCDGTTAPAATEPDRRGSIGRRFLRTIVQSPVFDYGSALLVILNSILVGVQTDLMAKEVLEHPPLLFLCFDIAFCSFFTIELGMRIGALGQEFFKSQDWAWNVFDIMLVVLQILDVLLSQLLENETNINFSMMRVLRLLRVARITRMFRVLRLISELRTIVASLLGSAKSLLWAVVLLFMVVYIFAVIITQQVLDYRVARKKANDGNFDSRLDQFFGNIGRSLLALYQVVTGGVDWRDMTEPLIAEISAVMGLVLVVFTLLATVALMNVVTGVFVETSLKKAEEDRKAYMLRRVRELFQEADPEASGCIDWARFESCLSKPFMQEFFQLIGVDISEAPSVFALLDTDDSGEVDLDEFLHGCINLHGGAQSIHLANLMYESRISSSFVAEHLVNLRLELQQIANSVSGGTVSRSLAVSQAHTSPGLQADAEYPLDAHESLREGATILDEKSPPTNETAEESPLSHNRSGGQAFHQRRAFADAAHKMEALAPMA